MSPLRIGLNTKTSWLMRGSRVGTGGPDPPPLKNHKNKGFLSNTGPDPLKIEKLPSQHSMLGHHRPAPISETPFKWRFAGGPMIARFKFYWDSLSPHKKRCQSFDKTFWIRAYDDGLYRWCAWGPEDCTWRLTTYWFFFQSQLLLFLHLAWEFYIAKWW